MLVFFPGIPAPILLLSILVTGTIPLMLVVRKTSFFFLSSLRVIVLYLFLNGEIFRTVARVIPFRTWSFLVQRVFPSNQKRFEYAPSVISFFLFTKIASKAPCLAAFS